MRCFVCGKGTLRKRLSQIEGEVRREKYSVEMDALVCSGCGHVALEGKDMQEFLRLLADAYRRAHDLLTSEEIRQIRTGMSQQEFANKLRFGVASIKRWELGGIQTEHADKTMRAFASRSSDKWLNYECVGVKRREITNWPLGSGLVGLANGPPTQDRIACEIVSGVLSYDYFPRSSRNSRRLRPAISLRVARRHPRSVRNETCLLRG